MKDIKIEVTQEDIQLGEPGEGGACPIALALNRQFGDCDPCVDEDTIEFQRDGVRLYFESPDPARRFVSDFDAEEEVAPVTITLTKGDLEKDDEDEDDEDEDEEDDLDGEDAY